MGHREISKKWMRNMREVKHKERLLRDGKCPECEMILASKFHYKCSFLGDVFPKGHLREPKQQTFDKKST